MVTGGRMMQYLKKEDENRIKQILDDLAKTYHLLSERKEIYQMKKSLYIDHLWRVKIGEEKVPIVAFEIEKSIPNNERIRKDIFNLLSSKAPIGYIVLPHNRITNFPPPKPDKYGQVKWYKKHFFKVFENYYQSFKSFIDIRLVDADDVLQNRRLKPIKSQG